MSLDTYVRDLISEVVCTHSLCTAGTALLQKVLDLLKEGDNLRPNLANSYRGLISKESTVYKELGRTYYVAICNRGRQRVDSAVIPSF